MFPQETIAILELVALEVYSPGTSLVNETVYPKLVRMHK